MSVIALLPHGRKSFSQADSRGSRPRTHSHIKQKLWVRVMVNDWAACTKGNMVTQLLLASRQNSRTVHIFGFWATDGSLGWWKLITLVLRVCFPVNLWCHVSIVWVLPAAQKQISLVIISVLSDTTSLLCDIRSLYLILGAYSQNVEEVVTKS